jgi:hypothetical protein
MLSALRHHLNRAALLVWLALFGLVVVPTVSRALVAADPVAYAAVCSATGQADPASALGAGHAVEACGLCAVAALPVVPALSVQGVSQPGCAAPTPTASSPPAPSAAWRIARSRAPPLLG